MVKIDENCKEVTAEYDDRKEFVIDPAGYFLIRIQDGLIEVGFCEKPGVVNLIVRGKKPIAIYQTIINKVGLEIRKDHYAYLGRELQKAYIALEKGLAYIQDDELKF